MHISYYIDDFVVFSFFLSNWILMNYIRFIIRSSQTPRSSSWHCRCCSQLAPSHYQKIMTRHMTLDDQLNSTLQFTYLIELNDGVSDNKVPRFMLYGHRNTASNNMVRCEWKVHQQEGSKSAGFVLWIFETKSILYLKELELTLDLQVFLLCFSCIWLQNNLKTANSFW